MFICTNNINEILKQLQEENISLKQELHKLKIENEELKRRLGLNSGNSGKPPSSDGLGRGSRKDKGLRAPGEKKQGGQLGHKGVTLERNPNPDKLVIHTPNKCSSCNQDLSSVEAGGSIARQVIDIPPSKIETTEHRAEIKICECGCKNIGQFPEGVIAPVQYGARIQALSVYLQHQQLIPEDRVSEILKDIFAASIAPSTVAKMGSIFSGKLNEWNKNTEEELARAPVKHLDETGFRVGGKTLWLHVLSNGVATFYRIAQRRGEMFIGLCGTIVHDHFKSYYKLSDLIHALCNAHHLRELKALREFEKEAWAYKMYVLLCYANKKKREWGEAEQEVIQSERERILQSYDKIVERGIAYHDSLGPVNDPSIKKRGRIKHRIGHNLLLRFKNHKEEVLRFLVDTSVPFTNNTAEQDLRMMKVKMKISGGFRSMEGANIFCKIRGFISTCRKQGKNPFQELALLTSVSILHSTA